MHAQVQDVVSVNSASIARAEPQGNPDNGNIEETQEIESGESEDEAGVESGEDDVGERDKEEDEEESGDEEESETETENEEVEDDVTERGHPKWTSVKSIHELT